MEENIIHYSSVKSFKNNSQKIENENENISKGILKYYQKVNEDYKKNGNIKNNSFSIKTSNSHIEENILKLFIDKWDELKEDKLNTMDYEQFQKSGKKLMINFIENSPNYIKEGISEINKNGGFLKDKKINSSDVSYYFKPNGKPTKISKKSKIKDLRTLSFRKSSDQISFWYSFSNTLSSIEHILVYEPTRFGLKYPKSEKIFEDIVKNLEKVIMKYDKEMINYNKKAILEGINNLN